MGYPMAEYSDKDLGLKALLKRLKEFKKAIIKIGVQGPDSWKMTDGVPVVRYAAANEFGTKNAGRNRNVVIPERSFLRSTTDKKKGWRKEIDQAYVNVFEGKDAAIAAIAKVGIVARDDVIQTITDGVAPANARSTIAKKKSSKTLIDTGTLRNSISYKFANKEGN